MMIEEALKLNLTE